MLVPEDGVEDGGESLRPALEMLRWVHLQQPQGDPQLGVLRQTLLYPFKEDGDDGEQADADSQVWDEGAG